MIWWTLLFGDAWTKHGECGGCDESRSNSSVKRFDIARETDSMSIKAACRGILVRVSFVPCHAAYSGLFFSLAELPNPFWCSPQCHVPPTIISWNRHNPSNYYLYYCVWSANSELISYQNRVKYYRNYSTANKEYAVIFSFSEWKCLFRFSVWNKLRGFTVLQSNLMP